jgi:hypothetical protein
VQKYKTYGREDDPQSEEGDGKIFGVNQRLAPDKLPAGLCADAQNTRMRDGVPTTRPGSTRPGWLNVTRASVDAMVKGVGAFYGAGSFKDPNGFEWVLTAADGGIFRHRPHNGRTAMPLPLSVKVLSDCSFCQAFNVVYCFRGKYLQPLVMSNVDGGFADLVARWSSSTVYNAAILATGQVAQEVAYGPFQSITSLTSVGDLATCVTTIEHGYVSGADVVIKGAVETGYNGRWNIMVLDVNTFTFQFNGATGSPATGTPKVSNMALYWKALGSRITLGVGEMTFAAGTVTVAHTAHGFSNGQYVTVAGASVADYNGTFPIASVADANHFTYLIGTSPASPAVGAPTITCRTSVVLAGQNPDTNPEAWQQIFNVLPNCDDAIFVNNRLLAPTSYTPGNTAYDSTSTYTKKDFLVSLDIGDLVHFDFVNEFRINQGGDDEIVQLLKAPSGAVNAQGVSTDAVIVIKGKSWAALTGVSGDLSEVALDMHPDGYGGTGLRCGVVAGRNVLFTSSTRGVVSLVQFQNGQARSVDIPFSNDVPAWVGRIQWQYGEKCRLAYWDDKLYVAVPIDDAIQRDYLPVPSGVFNEFGIFLPGNLGMTVGQTYWVEPGNVTLFDFVTAGQPLTSGSFVEQGIYSGGQWEPSGMVWTGPPGAVPTGRVYQQRMAVNNAVLIYDFRVPRVPTGEDSPYLFETGQWCSLDLAGGLCVKEWFKATYNGRERLFFIGEDGWANMVEEADAGDQVEDGTTADGLSWGAVVLDWTSRGYRLGTDAQKKYKWLELVLGIWNAAFDVWKGNQAAARRAADATQAVIVGKSFSRTKYLKPVGKADYVDANVNGEFFSPGRGDYSIPLNAPLQLGATGLQADIFQEVVARQSVRTLNGRYAQFRVRNARGRMQIKAVTPTAGEGQRRAGILI